LLSKAIYVSEQVCIRWRRTAAYYTAKLTFSHDSYVKVWGAYCTSVQIILSVFHTNVGVLHSCANLTITGSLT